MKRPADRERDDEYRAWRDAEAGRRVPRGEGGYHVQPVRYDDDGEIESDG